VSWKETYLFVTPINVLQTLEQVTLFSSSSSSYLGRADDETGAGGDDLDGRHRSLSDWEGEVEGAGVYAIEQDPRAPGDEAKGEGGKSRWVLTERRNVKAFFSCVLRFRSKGLDGHLAHSVSSARTSLANILAD
jgi:hypothetical protein